MAEMRDTTPGTAQAVSDLSRRQLVSGAVLAVLASGAAHREGSTLLDLHEVSPVAEDEGPDAELIEIVSHHVV